MEPVKSMQPACLSIIPGITARAKRKAEVRLTDKIACQSCRLVPGMSVADRGSIPAVCTRMSTAPAVFTASSAVAGLLASAQMTVISEAEPTWRRSPSSLRSTRTNRGVKNLPRWSHLHHAAGVHHHDAVRGFSNEAHLVAHKKHCDAPSSKVFDHIKHIAHQFGI